MFLYIKNILIRHNLNIFLYQRFIFTNILSEHQIVRNIRLYVYYISSVAAFHYTSAELFATFMKIIADTNIAMLSTVCICRNIIYHCRYYIAHKIIPLEDDISINYGALTSGWGKNNSLVVKIFKFNSDFTFWINWNILPTADRYYIKQVALLSRHINRQRARQNCSSQDVSFERVWNDGYRCS